MSFNKLGVVGCGLMGSGIAEVAARRGLEVIVRECDDAAMQKGRERIERSLERGVKADKIAASEADAAFSRLSFVTDLEALADREIVIEAVFENETVKTDVFRQLDRIVQDENAILASNTSSIPIMKLGVETQRPAQVCGLHFFNPVPVLDLLELVTSLMTSAETVERATRFADQQLGKHVVRSKDRAGFIVNALLIPYILSAIRMFESGFATKEDIDAGMVKGCAHPMGPLALADLIGLDTTMAVAHSMYEEFKEPLYAAPPLLCRMVEAGLLGRKTGHGFYDYAKK